MRAASRRFVLLPLLTSVALLGFAVAAQAAESSQPSQRKTTQSESYIMIEPIYSSILEGGRPRGLLVVELGLDVPDAQLRGEVTHALPALRDAYVRGLLTYAATAVRPWRQPDVEDISKRIQAITDRMVGRQGARVLLAQTAIRLSR